MHTFNKWLKIREEADETNDDELAAAMHDKETAFGKHDYARSNADTSPEDKKKHFDAYQQASQRYKALKAQKNQRPGNK